MAEAHVTLARRLIRRFSIRWPALADEFESAAMFALCEAAESWNISGGVSYQYLANRRISGAMVDVLRREVPAGYRRRKMVLPTVTQMLACDEANGIQVLCCRPQPPVGRDLESAEEVDRWLRYLRVSRVRGSGRHPDPARRAEAIRLICLEELTVPEAAKVMGCTERNVKYLFHHGLTALRRVAGQSDMAG